MKEDNSVLEVKHLCGNCNLEMELSTTEELCTIDFGTLSILTYVCQDCYNKLNVIDSKKEYLHQVGNYLVSQVLN